MTNPNTLVVITPVSPSGLPGITFNLLGDATYQPATGGTGGWQIIDRPKMVAATQWYDRSPMELDLPVAITSPTTNGVEGQSVELPCLILETWQDAVVGTLVPPVLSITGPIPGLQRLWVLQNMELDEALRDPTGGFRILQQFKLTFWEFTSVTGGTIGTPSPAEAFLAGLTVASGASSYLLYTVVQGDTLSSIAATWLGNADLWTSIASLNNLRDPTSIVAGQVLKLPYT